VPIVYVVLGDELWSPIDGKPKSGRELARVGNLRRDPRATLLLQHYDADWQRLWWLRLECEAEVVTIADPPGDEAAYDVIPPSAELPRPRRGKALEDRIFLRLIAVERAIHSVIFGLFAIGLLLARRDLSSLR